MADLEIIAIHDIGEVRPGDDLAELIAAADDAHLQDGDCLVITQKVVSKAEGRLVDIDPTDPLSHKPLVEAESVRILRRAANSSSLRLNTASSAPTPASICRMSSGVRPPAAGRQRPISAGFVIVFGPDTATTSPSSSATPLVARGVAVSPMSPSVAPVSGPSLTCEEPPTHSARAHGHRVAVVDEIAAAADLVMGKAKGVAVRSSAASKPSGSGEVRSSTKSFATPPTIFSASSVAEPVGVAALPVPVVAHHRGEITCGLPAEHVLGVGRICVDLLNVARATINNLVRDRGTDGV